ncbi:CHRD domain-containing protein [Laceyella putida]|uniref:CHRD domain-containing protein n=1 Tax=Laceyella putida TaxID=110101 RepID=A0ABW2RFJ4_9BACL
MENDVRAFSVDGRVGVGTLAAKSLTDPLRGQSIADLVRLIKVGRIDVSAHTEQNPDGEIRGQVRVRAIRK